MSGKSDESFIHADVCVEGPSRMDLAFHRLLQYLFYKFIQLLRYAKVDYFRSFSLVSGTVLEG